MSEAKQPFKLISARDNALTNQAAQPFVMADAIRTAYPVNAVETGIRRYPNGSDFVILTMHTPTGALFCELTPDGVETIAGSLTELGEAIRGRVEQQATEAINEAMPSRKWKGQ